MYQMITDKFFMQSIFLFDETPKRHMSPKEGRGAHGEILLFFLECLTLDGEGSIHSVQQSGRILLPLPLPPSPPPPPQESAVGSRRGNGTSPPLISLAIRRKNDGKHRRREYGQKYIIRPYFVHVLYNIYDGVYQYT